MEKKKAAPPVADINVTPMVDVMLVLLIIFMVITPMLTKGQSVDKVKTKNPVTMQAADKEDAILISITRNGSVFLSPGNIRLSGPDQLPERVRDLLTNRVDKTVYIVGDARARYSIVEDVVDNLRAAGVNEIGLITEEPHENKTPQQAAADAAAAAAAK
ncbi:MAG: biopolymer transporter ExbD [Bryobacteraceae bacterium]|jgi:biopolymer transport protein ExbD/biopolymer transport protein TolR